MSSMNNIGYRWILLSLGMYFLFSLLIFQFFRLQVLEEEKWSKLAKKQHFFVVKEPFKRGSIWSNTTIKKGHPEVPQKLVFDILKYHLYADPDLIPHFHKKVIAAVLTYQLDPFHANFSSLGIENQLFRKSRNRKLATWICQEKKEELLTWWQGYANAHHIARNALYFVPDYQRSYPFGKLLGQVLHTVQNQRDALTQQPLPTGGIELAFHSALQGKEGKRLLQRSPRHSFETGQVIESAQDGKDLYLTINHYLQAIAEEEVEKGVKRCGAKSGWAVMMDPYTGEILALAQYPFFYPEKYPEYFNNVEKIEWTKVKAITDAYEPGSIMKPITAAIALLANQELEKKGEKPLFDPEEMMPCGDGRFPGRTKPIRDLRFHRYLDLNMAIQKSSNIYFSRLAQRIVARLGDRWYRNALQNLFGFGIKGGIELPSESGGVLPTPGKLHPNGTLEWSVPTPFSLAMGHNIQATSIQMLRAWAILANGGRWVKPTLIKREFQEFFPTVLDQKIIDRVIEAMKYTTKPGGSGRRADIFGYTEVGKTGTADKIVGGVYSKNTYIASFMGFAPVKDPAFVLLVSMDEPESHYIPGLGKNHGSLSGAPVFKEIARRSLEYLGVALDDPYGYPVGDPRYNPEQADWAFETRQLREKYEKWNN